MRALNHGGERPETKTAFLTALVAAGFFRERAEKLAPEHGVNEPSGPRDRVNGLISLEALPVRPVCHLLPVTGRRECED
jgi:hypothetical protein